MASVMATPACFRLSSAELETSFGMGDYGLRACVPLDFDCRVSMYGSLA
jgi:hypothetical protein